MHKNFRSEKYYLHFSKKNLVNVVMRLEEAFYNISMYSNNENIFLNAWNRTNLRFLKFKVTLKQSYY